MNKEEFIKELKKINITLTEEQLKKLDIYQKKLIEYNKHTNLTAIKTPEEIYLKHFYDSLTINKYIKEKEKILDIGTGAGFPGMVLAVLNPKTSFVLLDSNNKKIAFLEYLNTFLKLKNVTFVHERAEDYVRKNQEKFDIVTSRAVAELRILAELSIPALKLNGYFIPLKANIDTELKDLEIALSVLNGKIEEKIELNLPNDSGFRTILKIKHTETTNKIFPRRYDKIRNNNLIKMSK